MDTVKLYYFEGYDFHDDRVVRSRRPAAADFIARMGYHRGEDNAVQVDSSQVDAEGLLAGDS
jgi:hypothetical protein